MRYLNTAISTPNLESRDFITGKYKEVILSAKNNVGFIPTEMLMERLFLYNQLIWNNRPFSFNILETKENDKDSIVNKDIGLEVIGEIIYTGVFDYSFIAPITLANNMEGKERRVISHRGRVTVLYEDFPTSENEAEERKLFFKIELFLEGGELVGFSDCYSYREFKDILLENPSVKLGYQFIDYSDIPYFIDFDKKVEVKNRKAEVAKKLEYARLEALKR